ncbi:structural maintenance of chromosomes protein 5 [Gadus chalcogrammus]|uniref:structural maintenance of chromosomes protein 5 n=1 Tax=Gadus chalcogrammus TaxID=1042646 RepID=UPI0024C33C16|nr:structural maintenance of chromosomes protein 5 [Gadus chalcogrammus]
MADRSKRQRISRAASTSQVTNNVPPMFGGSQPDARVASDGEPGRFVEGSILRIAMNNFLTYELAVVNPGANLNMIVGANGTGKSSIVCAICLGLAGKTALLGRGDKIGLFVKRGCSRGSIEIELYKNGGNVVINREISTENLSQWTLNGKSCSQKVVEEEVKALQIQVSNLCQFLPQEKVGEFAKMSRIELLEATEKSVGPPEMYTYHCELKNFRGRERELENTVNEKAAFLERAKQKNESNKLDMNRYYEKKRHLDMIELLEKKKPWVEFEAVRKEHESVKTEREEVKKRLSSLKQTHGPMLKKIQLINNQLEPIEAQIKTKTIDIKEAARKCKARQDQLDRKQKEIDDIKQALNLKHTEKVDEEKRIANTKTIIDDLQKELATVGEQPDVSARIDAISVELRGHQEERARLDGEKSDIRREKDNMVAESKMFTRRLNDMNNMMKAKEDKLKVRHKDTFTAIQWLRQNRQLFSGNVHEPMLLVLNVKDPRFAKYVETHIAFNDLRGFLFEKREDMEAFMKEVRDKLKLRVNSILAPAVSCANKQPSRPIESLKRFGFYSYLREMFDAPTDVVSYLCHQYNMHDVPVGTAQTKAMINKVIEEPYLKLIYTADERYVVKKSIYSNHVSTNNSQLRPSKFLTISVDAEEKGQVEQQIQNCERKIKDLNERLAGLQENFSTLEGRDNELRNEKKGLVEQKGKKRQLEQKIATKLDSLQQIEKNRVDLKKLEEDTKTKIGAVNAQKVAIMVEVMDQIKLRASLSMLKVHLTLQTLGLTAEKTHLEGSCKDRQAELRMLEDAFTRLDTKKNQLHERCKGLMRSAQTICNMGAAGTVPAELKVAFSTLPDTMEELDALLNEECSRAEGFTGIRENVVEEYNRREVEIQNLEKELGDQSEALNTYRMNMSEAKERWLNPLRTLICQINERFGEYFRSMQCVGEVDLHSEKEEEYDKYGIRIRVKFHNSTELHELTAHHQSGGERSVSTMLYLMALQELNRCPFRVVDEINQGMDPINERRVFNIVVRTACKETTSQYFFITPKLLQDLQYAEEMTVLCIHNGPQMLSPGDWDEKAFLRRIARRKNRTKPE